MVRFNPVSRFSPTLRNTIIVAIGGFIFGFDASVISGAIGFIDTEFGLSEWQQGFVVSSPTLGALLAMCCAGAVSDVIGRRKMLIFIAALYFMSSLTSAMSVSYTMLVCARFIGGMAFCCLLTAPMYIAEISAPYHRGRMISVNQLAIVLGFAVSYFSNFMFLQLSTSEAAWVQQQGTSDHVWRFMVGIEVIPAAVWFCLLFTVPRSPRWLMLNNRHDEARAVVHSLFDSEQAEKQLADIGDSLEQKSWKWRERLGFLLTPKMRFPLTIGLILGIAQQITGINVIFFYAPTIFEHSGVGTDAAFMQAIFIGLVNIIFTVVAMVTIDRWGRKPLLITGLCGVILSMSVCAYGFKQATYKLDSVEVAEISLGSVQVQKALTPLEGIAFDSDVEFKQSLRNALGDDLYDQYQRTLLSKGIDMNAPLVLFGIIAFVASFAMSLGPVMWAMLAEIFPSQSRALAISVVGVMNSLSSFLVQFLFPWELLHFGAALTFAIYGVFALISLFLVIRLFPETRGRTLEQIAEGL